MPRTVKSHYHPTDQFQIVVEGETKFPEHTLEAGDVHYSDRMSAYGPFVVPERLALGIFRRRKVGLVYMDAPPSFGSKAGPSGREVYYPSSKTGWEDLGAGVRRKLTSGQDGKSPWVALIEGKRGATLETDRAPFGEYIVFFKGKFQTQGREIESYSLRDAEAEDKTPSIVCESDGATIIVAKFDRPMLANESATPAVA